ncbi:hypothetical protein B1H10_05415 [candidate division KSB1 bacterium 4484_188]|nr:MAG: hypothetical protein B1H10_05415 [candidate division KSB1 bacterium 4484_188]
MTKKVFILLLCLLPFTGLFAGTSGKITGVVKDKENKEALIGVNIQILGLPLGGASDVDGFYFINNVPPGTYTLKATYLGYRPVEIKNVQVTVDHTTEISIEMEPASIEFEETITVVAERPLIQKDATSKRAVIDGSQIADILPVSTVREALAMQAGVVKDEDGQIHIRGGRLGEVAYLIDGTYVRDPFDNSLGGNVDVEAIQEMEVISGTFNAEYGNAMSGIVNIVTKEGSPTYKIKFQYETPMLNESPYHRKDWLLYTDEVKKLPEAEKEKYKDAVRTETGESAYREFRVLDSKFSDLTGLNVLGKFNSSLSGPVPFFSKMHFFVSGTFRNEDSYLPYGFTLERY